MSPIKVAAARPLAAGHPSFVIQHPGGGPKKVGLYRNEIRHVGSPFLQYLTETGVGSSGSPVFNKEWEVIALHHRWIEADGTDATSKETRNQGVLARPLTEALRSAGITFDATSC